MTPEKMIALSLGFAGTIFLAQHARAQDQSQCAPRDRVVAVLGETYGETRRSAGLAGNSTVMELYASDMSGTWTITVTLPSGLTCLVASGGNFQAEAPSAATPGDDA
jgi:hypothetical protein